MQALQAHQIVGVVGAGAMGAGIAQVAAAAGHPVLLFDVQPQAATRAMDRIHDALQKRVRKGKLAAEDCQALMARISPCDTLESLAEAALVIEAIVEKLDVKRQLFVDLEKIIAPTGILASNTSSISITAIAAALTRPARLVGMHFFNPAPLMALVEIVSGLATDGAVADTVYATASAWGKCPVHASSTPGFIVNRVARPFYAEALRVLQEGAADPATLDAIMREAGGFRMGPFELMDLIGHDVNFAVTRSVFDAYYGDPRFTPSLIQQELVEAGFLGRKSGRGFYDYGDTAQRPEPHTAALADPPQRVRVHGDVGPLEGLLPLLGQAGIEIHRQGSDGEDGWLELDDRLALALSDGRSATERMARDGGKPLVLVDLALDYAQAQRLALAPAHHTSAAELALASGLLQRLGKTVSVIQDVPGMLVARTVCMLANEGADAVNQGVCSVASVDLAMCQGVNYPLGPLAWAERLGLQRVVTLLHNLAASYGEDRYRVSPLLRSAMFADTPLATMRQR